MTSNYMTSNNMTSNITDKLNKINKYVIDRSIKEEKGILYEAIESEWIQYWNSFKKENDMTYFPKEVCIKAKNDFIKKKFDVRFKNKLYKNFKINEKLIEKVLNPINLGNNDDDRVERLENLGFLTFSSDDEY